MLIKAKSVVSWMRAYLSAISLADIQKYLVKIIILAPVTMLLICLAIFSQPRYMSESKAAIKCLDDPDSGSLDFGLLLSASNPSSAENASYLKECINSPNMLTALDRQLNFREAFSHSGSDFFNHFSEDETAEGFLKYYKDRINVSYDDRAGLLNIQTQGFSPEFALRFSQTVSRESERFINEVSHRIARDWPVFAEMEMEKARQRLGANKAELFSYQDSNSAPSPQAQVQTVSTLVNTLMGQKIQMEADLRNLLTYPREDTPQIVSARNTIQLLQTQIDEEQSRITTPRDDKLDRMTTDLEEIKLKIESDAELYKPTLTFIERTRVGAARKLKMLSMISSSQLPQKSFFPNIPYSIVCWLLVCCPLFGTLELLLATIKDHRDQRYR